MDAGMTSIVFVIGVILTAFVTTIFAVWDYELYKCVFGHGCHRRGTSITDKAWFRALMTPLIFFPALNVAGLIILLYMRAMKGLDIN